METLIIDQYMSLRLVNFHLTWHTDWADKKVIICPLNGYFLTSHTKGVKALKLTEKKL